MGIPTTSTSSITLANAMGPDMDKPARWYQYHETTAQYHILPQVSYEGQTIFYMKQPTISFLNEYFAPTPLHCMLQKECKVPGWEEPWTKASHQDVGQKITLRVRLEGCIVNKQVNVRRFTDNAEACTKSKLGREIAKVLSEPLQKTCRLLGIPFEYIVLYGLEHVSQGSWQPVLGIQNTSTVYNSPLRSKPVNGSYDTPAFACVSPVC